MVFSLGCRAKSWRDKEFTMAAKKKKRSGNNIAHREGKDLDFRGGGFRRDPIL